MKKIVYYSPAYFNNELYRGHAKIQKLVAANGSIIDRTGIFEKKMDYQVLWGIPLEIHNSNTLQLDFEEYMIQRAEELLASTNEIIIFYSGGLDSTSTLIAFDEAIKRNPHFSKQQIVIATSAPAMYENIWCWWEIVMKYNIKNVHDIMDDMSFGNNKRYILSENADQLFGGLALFNLTISPLLLHTQYSTDNLIFYLNHLQINDEYLVNAIEKLVGAAPFKIETMKELFWWINFTCKWQAVSLRAFVFSDIFLKKESVTLGELKYFETFYNTPMFQKICMNKNFNRFNDTPSAESYKYAFRLFILKHHPSWGEYVNTKVKVGSLYNVIRHRDLNIKLLEIDSDTQLITASAAT